MSCEKCKNKTTNNNYTNPFKKDSVITKKTLSNLCEENVFEIYNKFAIEPIEPCNNCIGTIQKMIQLLNHFKQK